MYGFLLGLTGSWHCAVMCGPILSFFFKEEQKNYIGIFFYQFGRIFIYALLGFLVAYLGTLGLFAKFWYLYFIIVGVFIALLLLGIIKDQNFTFFHQIFGRRLQEIGKKMGKVRFLFFGMSNGFLPCGLVMAGLSTSLIQNNPLLGALNMVYFGMGTLPILFLSVLGFNHSKQINQLLGGKILQIIAWLVVFALLFQGIWGILAQISESVKNHPLTPIICH
jgi:uncharacterized protein